MKSRKVGRPPQGEYSGKSAVFSTRITPQLRSGLEREARRSGQSLSQEIERRLSQSLSQRKTGLSLEKEHNQALAVLIGMLAGLLEMQTGRSWQEDRYTFDALRAAIDFLLTGFAANFPEASPKGDMEIPALIRERVKHDPTVGQQYEKPQGAAVGSAYGLLQQLQHAEYPPERPPKNRHYGDLFYTLPWVREKLGVTGGVK